VIVVDNLTVDLHTLSVEPIDVAFGASVRRHRRKLRLSQDELAQGTGMRRASIASIEAGRQVVSLHQAVEISMRLGVQVQTMIDESRGVTILNEEHGSLADQDLEIIRQLHQGLGA
jgi:DNA-binding XRE family transcriptional regulator